MGSYLETLEAKLAEVKAHYANVAREDTDDSGEALPDPDAITGAGYGLAEESDDKSDDKS